MAKYKKLDLIPELTTYKNDFKQWTIRTPPSEPAPPPPPPKIRKRPKYAQTDYQSHFEYMNYVPFDLYIRKDPITGNDPWTERPQHMESEKTNLGSNYLSLKIPGKEELEVDDEEIITPILINNYVPVHREIFETACLKTSTSPELAKTVLINDDVRFKPELYAPLSHKWLAAAKHWDCLQNRMLGDPTKTFWSRRGPEVECFSKSDFKSIIPKETREEISQLIDEDRLRLPFMNTSKGYMGYQHRAAKGVSLARKKEFLF